MTTRRTLWDTPSLLLAIESFPFTMHSVLVSLQRDSGNTQKQKSDDQRRMSADAPGDLPRFELQGTE